MIKARRAVDRRVPVGDRPSLGGGCEIVGEPSQHGAAEIGTLIKRIEADEMNVAKCERIIIRAWGRIAAGLATGGEVVDVPIGAGSTAVMSRIAVARKERRISKNVGIDIKDIGLKILISSRGDCLCIVTAGQPEISSTSIGADIVQVANANGGLSRVCLAIV